MPKNMDEPRDRGCSSHDKDLNSGHNGTVRRAQLARKHCRNYTRIARESLMVTCHVVFRCLGMAYSDKLLRRDQVPRGLILGARYMSRGSEG